MSPEQNPTTPTNNVEEKHITQEEWNILNEAGNASIGDSQAARELAAGAAGKEVKNKDGSKSVIITVLDDKTGQVNKIPVVELAKEYLSDFPDVLKLLNEQERALREGNDWRLPK